MTTKEQKVLAVLMVVGVAVMSLVGAEEEASKRFFKGMGGKGMDGLSGLPIGSYPLWKFHKYDGLSLKPVPIGLEIGSGIPAPPPAYLSSMPVPYENNQGALGGASLGNYGPPAYPAPAAAPLPGVSSYPAPQSSNYAVGSNYGSSGASNYGSGNGGYAPPVPSNNNYGAGNAGYGSSGQSNYNNNGGQGGAYPPQQPQYTSQYSNGPRCKTVCPDEFGNFGTYGSQTYESPIPFNAPSSPTSYGPSSSYSVPPVSYGPSSAGASPSYGPSAASGAAPIVAPYEQAPQGAYDPQYAPTAPYDPQYSPAGSSQYAPQPQGQYEVPAVPVSSGPAPYDGPYKKRRSSNVSEKNSKEVKERSNPSSSSDSQNTSSK